MVDVVWQMIFLEGLGHFMNFTIEYVPVESVEKLRCPCEMCQNRNIVEYATVRVHLFKKGFVPNYYYWTSQGEVTLPTN